MHGIRSTGLVLTAVLFGLCAGCGTLQRSPAGPESHAPSRSPTGPYGISFEDRVEANARFAAGVTYELRGDRAQALKEFHLAARADWANEQLVSDVARRLLADRQADQAVEILTRCAGTRDSTANLHLLLALAYREAGQPAKAITAAREAVRRAPQHIAPYQNLVQLHLAEKRPQEARKILEEAVKAVPREPVENLLGLAELLAGYVSSQSADREKYAPRIAAFLDEAAQQKPTAPPLLARLAEGYSFTGEHAKAAQIYLDLLTRFPNLPDLRDRLIRSYYRNQDWQKAAAQLEALIRDNPSNANAYLILSDIAHKEKQYDRAADYLEKVLIFRPEMEEAYYDLAGLRISENKAQEALGVLTRARQKFSSRFLLEFYTGLAYNRLEQYGEALRYFTAAEVVARAGETNRLTHFFYFQLGATSERHKDFEQAEKYFRQCLDMQPDFADALNYLGYMWAERGVNLQEARRMIEKAVKLEPENAAFLDSMAWVLFKLNRPKEALDWQLKALQHSEEPDATLYDHLGDIHAALNQHEQARAAWKKSLEIEPNEDIRRKLDPAGTSSRQ
jgi:tetratricopeptide (TPR) repeat protein